MKNTSAAETVGLASRREPDGRVDVRRAHERLEASDQVVVGDVERRRVDHADLAGQLRSTCPDHHRHVEGRGRSVGVPWVAVEDDAVDRRGVPTSDGAGGAQDVLHRERLQAAGLVVRDLQLIEQASRQLVRSLATRQSQLRATLHDSTMDQASSRRCRRDEAHLATAAGLAVDRHIRRVTPERGDVRADPLQRGDHVEESGVGRTGEVVAGEIGEVKVAHHAETVIEGHHDDVAATRHVRSVVQHHRAGPRLEPSPVQPHEHGPSSVVRTRRPDVEHETVLADGGTIPVEPTFGQPGSGLGRGVAVSTTGPHAGPGRRRLRRAKTVRSAGRRSIGNAAEDADAIDDTPLNGSVGGGHHCAVDRFVSTHMSPSVFHYTEHRSVCQNRQMGGAVAKSFKVLEAVATAQGPVRLSTLCVELGMQKSTVHRILSELIELGYIEQDSSTGLYGATLRSWEIGSAVIADLPIKQVASSALHDLHRQTGETVSLVVRSGDDALYLDKIVSPRPIRFTTRVGSRVPLPLPAGGKAILAMSADGDDVVRRTASRDDLGVPYDVDGVLRSISTARRAGYAISIGWGITSVAAAVVDRSDAPVAALAVSAPTDRVKGRRDDLIEAVVTTATRLSEVASRA